MTSLLDPVRGVASDLAAPLWRAVGATPGRRTAIGSERSHLEVRGLHGDDAAEARALVEKRLAELPGVRAAAVNAVLARVVVDHDPSVGVAELLEVIAEVEEGHGRVVDDGPATGARHPADGTPRHRQLVALGVDVVGLGVVLAERALVPLPLTGGLVPPAATALLSLAESVPTLRALAERTAGASAAESWFSIGAAAAQALGRGPVGLVTDACYRTLRAREAGARRRAWRELDAVLDLDDHRADPAHAVAHETARPAALRSGSVQRVGEASGAGALGAMAVVAAVVPSRATAVVLAGAPKAARWGWEAFAAAAGHALAGRGVVVLDPTVLRRADRVDVVLLDARLPDTVVRQAGGVGRVVVTATAPDAATVVELQSEGHGVAVLSADPAATEALAAADVAVAVGPAGAGRSAPVWTADLLCADPDGALAVLAVLAAAPVAARRAAAIALLATGAALPVALLFPLPGLHRWASLPVTSGALLSLGVGTWSGTAAVAPAPAS